MLLDLILKISWKAALRSIGTVKGCCMLKQWWWMIISTIGTCNMDYRFEVNFEINALIFDKETTTNLSIKFDTDIKDCQLIDLEMCARQVQKTHKFKGSFVVWAPLLLK
jgi:hypothetical protein